MKLEPGSDDLPSDFHNPAPIPATPALNLTFSLQMDSPLRGEIQHLERLARKNAEHHATVKALQRQHDEEVTALKAEHTALKIELRLRISDLEKNPNVDIAAWKQAIDLAEQEALEEPADSVDVVGDGELKGKNVPDRIADQDEDFVEEHLRSALEELLNIQDEEATKPEQSAPSPSNDAGHVDVMQQVQEAWDSQISDPQFLRRKIFALEKLFMQKSPIRHFDPKTDGAMDHSTEIKDLKKRFAQEEAKNSKLRNQLSEALSLLEKARQEAEQLADKDDSKNDTRSAQNPRLRGWLEELYAFSCDPLVEKELERQEEKLFQDIAGDHGEHDESSEYP